jgi:hypothetical protein
MRTSRVLSALAAVAGQSSPLVTRLVIAPDDGAADQGNAR